MQIEVHNPNASNGNHLERRVQYELEKDAFKRLEESTYKKSITLRFEGWLGKKLGWKIL
jgi:hypothetical protein